MGNFPEYKKNSCKASYAISICACMMHCWGVIEMCILTYAWFSWYKQFFMCFSPVFIVFVAARVMSHQLFMAGWVENYCAVSFLFWSYFVRQCVDVVMTQMCYVRLCGIQSIELFSVHYVTVCWHICAETQVPFVWLPAPLRTCILNCHIELNWMPLSFCVEFWWMLNTKRNSPFCLLRYVCPY